MNWVLQAGLTAVLALSVTSAGKKIEWWQQKAIYQVYPYSFMDSDDDGTGDLIGIKKKADYFRDIGVGGVWLSPIYESPGQDNGYDISNFTNINEIFGNYSTFDDLVEELKKKGIKLIMDFVPNHTSEKHPWFQKSIKGIEPYKDYYIWKDPKKDNGQLAPPNNWKSLFGVHPDNSAWEYNEDRKQYYYHAFGTFQPDLNYRNDKVVEEMKDVLKFWMDKGVCGFRMDAVPFIIEDDKLEDEPCNDGVKVCNDWGDFNHTHTLDQDLTYDVLSKFRDVLDSKRNDSLPPRVMMVEAYSPPDKLIKYYGTKDKPIANFPFNFNLIENLNKDSNGSVYEDTVNSWMENMNEDRWSNWVIGNHDKSRVGTRMGEDLIDGMNMLTLLLPGTAITYYGEELGMTDGYIRKNERKDKTNQNRDPQRTPFQWDSSLSAGFSKNNDTLYLPVNPNYWYVNVDAELKEKADSHLKVYKKLSALHQNLMTDLRVNTSTLGKDYMFSFLRYSGSLRYLTVLNLDNKEQNVNISEHFDSDSNLPKEMSIYTSSINAEKKEGKVDIQNLTMRARESLVLWNGSAGLASCFSVLVLALVFLVNF